MIRYPLSTEGNPFLRSRTIHNAPRRGAQIKMEKEVLKMKKLFALLLTLVMVLSLAACGAKE